MSGGYFDYSQYYLERMADDIEEVILNNDSTEKDSFGCEKGRHYLADIINKFRETVYALRRTKEMVQRIDWLLSDDDGEDSFRRRWIEEVPKEG